MGWQRQDSWYRFLSFAWRQANDFLIVYVGAFHKRKLETFFLKQKLCSVVRSVNWSEQLLSWLFAFVSGAL